MSVGDSRLVLYGALAANAAIAVTKFIAAAITGSSAMLAEGIHSTIDTGNALLLLLGLRLSARPADAAHPFGHGLDLYFWSLLVAMVIFGVGGGMSIYEGIRHLLHPEPLSELGWSFAVLAAAFVFEGASLALAGRSFRRARPPGESIWRGIRRSKNPAEYTVLVEDGAALLGIVIAGAGLGLAQLLDAPSLDAAASVVIGLLLAAVAVLLATEARGLLLGESAAPATVATIRRIVGDDPDVAAIVEALTVHVGADRIIVTLVLRFSGECEAATIVRAIARIKAAIRGEVPEAARIFIEPAAASVADAGAVDLASTPHPHHALRAGGPACTAEESR